MKQNREQNGPVVEDTIDRLMEARVSQTPPPGNVFRTTLEELRQTELRQPMIVSGRRNWWPRLVIGGLLVGGLLALSLVVLSTAVLVNKNDDQKGVSASRPTSLPGPINTVGPATTASTLAEQPALPSPRQSATADPNPTSANGFPDLNPISTPPASPANLALPTPLAASVPTAASRQAGYMIGTAVSYDSAHDLLKITTQDGKTVIIKFTTTTVVIRKGAVVKPTEIVTGEVLTISGKLNSDAQFEASSVALGILTQPKPVGDPGYPDDTK